MYCRKKSNSVSHTPVFRLNISFAVSTFFGLAGQLKLILLEDIQGQDLPQSFKNFSKPLYVTELKLFKINPAKILLRV